MNNDRINAYKSRIQAHIDALDANKRQYDFLSYSRFGLFILGIARRLFSFSS